MVVEVKVVETEATAARVPARGRKLLPQLPPLLFLLPRPRPPTTTMAVKLRPAAACDRKEQQLLLLLPRLLFLPRRSPSTTTRTHSLPRRSS